MSHRYRLTNRFYLAIALFMLAVFAVSFLVARARLSTSMSALAEKKSVRGQAAGEVAALEDQLAYTQTDAFIERAARDELGLIYPGEYRYVGNR